jgi:hypothetical protein
VRTDVQAAYDGMDSRPEYPEPGSYQQQIYRVGRGELPDAESVIARGPGDLRVQSRQQHHCQAPTDTTDKEPQHASNGSDGCKSSGRLLGRAAPVGRRCFDLGRSHRMAFCHFRGLRRSPSRDRLPGLKSPTILTRRTSTLTILRRVLVARARAEPVAFGFPSRVRSSESVRDRVHLGLPDEHGHCGA